MEVAREILSCDVKEATVWDAYKIADLWADKEKASDKDKEIFFLALLVKITSPNYCVVLIKDEFITVTLSGDVGICDYVHAKDNVIELFQWVTNYCLSYGIHQIEVSVPEISNELTMRGFNIHRIVYRKEV